MNAILVSVDYSDYLSACLRYNRHHFDRVLIVTSELDERNVRPIAEESRAEVFVTNSFYHSGAIFNKWAALEEGLDVLGRRGWICIMDADVLWPKAVWLPSLQVGTLYGPYRRMMPEFCGVIPPEDRWASYPLHTNVAEIAGYTQIFHAEDPHLGLPPWHQVDWTHAGGADSFFQFKWPVTHKVRPPFEVLHLGPAGRNWCGRSTPYLDGSRHPQAEVRAHRVRELFRGRIGKQGDRRFDHERLK